MIYLHVENRDRELWSRLLIALALWKKGIRSVVGSQRVLFANVNDIPKGVIVFKGANGALFPKAAEAVHAGHVVAVIDEEGLNVADIAHMLGEVAPDFPAAVSYVTTDAAAKAYPQAEKTGNPRLDLLKRPDLFDDAPRKGYTLVNTNTAGINHKGGADAYWAMCQSIGCFRSHDAFLGHLRHEDACIRAIRAFIDAHDGDIVLRPHPSENADRWRAYCADKPNVEVATEGSHISWIKGAECVVHTGCTTAIEAACLGVPSVSLLTGLPQDDVFVTNHAPYGVTDNPADALSHAKAPDVHNDGKAHERIADGLSEAILTPGDEGDLRLARPEVPMDPYFAAKVQTSIEDVVGFYQRWGVEVPVLQIGDSVFQIG